MSSKRFHDIQTPRRRGAPLKAVIGATDQKSLGQQWYPSVPANKGIRHRRVFPSPQVGIHFGNDNGLNEALEEESFKQLQICWVIHFVTGIQ